MDPNAIAALYLMRTRSPNTLQIIMRTEEISVDDDARSLMRRQRRQRSIRFQRMWNMLVQMWK